MSSTSPHAGRVAIITGAGAGVGRGYALRLAMQGARVVVNDIGGKRKGANQEKRIASNADAVVEEIHSLGGEAVADYEDVADWAGAQRLIQHALDAFGDLHVLICNAGILRDRTLINLSESDWDDVMRVHLKGSFAPAKHAAEYWRDKAKEQSPEAVNGRVILTSSVVGLFGNYGQTNYGGAKAALANIGTTLAAELDRYGVTVNTICPSGLTRMTEDLRPDFGSEDLERLKQRQAVAHRTDELVMNSPNNVAPLVCWLVSPEARHVNGRVFLATAYDNGYAMGEGWTETTYVRKADANWQHDEMAGAVAELLAQQTVPTTAERLAMPAGKRRNPRSRSSAKL